MTNLQVAAPAHPARPRSGRRRTQPIAYLLVAPFFVVFLVFQAFALMASLGLSFTDWRGVQGGSFVGFSNYLALVNDPQFLTALWHAGAVWLMTVPLLSFGGLALAWMLNSRLVRLRGTLRTLIFLPVLPSLVVAGTLFLLLLDPTFGLPNQLLSAIGLPTIDLRNDPRVALPVLALVIIWRYIGYNMVIHLAGLQTLPRTVLESAALDGASAWQTFWRVVVPMSKPMLIFTSILSTIGTVGLFDEPYVLFGSTAGPDQAGLMLGTYMYRQGFEYFNLGYASALTYVLTLIVILFSIVQMRMDRHGR